jgi:hypothetical protein
MSAEDSPVSVRLSFILGTGRCGSSLVHEVLSHHPDVGFVSNIDDRLAPLDVLGRWNGPLYRWVPPSATVKGRLRFAPSEGYRLLDRHVSPLLSEPDRDLTAGDVTPWLARQLERFFLRRAAAQRRQTMLHKFTGWPRARFLATVFPDARFVNVVRDGRSVASSWLQMRWWRGYRGPQGWQWGPLPDHYREQWERAGRSFVALAGIAWMMLMDASEACPPEVAPRRWLDVRYEDVIADPTGEHRRMLEFLQLPWESGLEKTLARYSFSGSRRDAFRRDLTPAQVALLEDVQGPRLARLGYR